MRETMEENYTPKSIKLIRKYLKLKLLEDNVTFRNHSSEKAHVYDLMKRTVSHAESHSALMIGPRGSGKTTLINSVLHQLSKEVDIDNDALIIRLNGLVHNDDKTALKAITAQMQLENAVGDRVFGTFAENLDFLFSCMQSSQGGCKSMLFILDEFDMFCRSGRTQTLLYNLFDITHGRRAPVCVLGITNRLDVLDLLEKRVKSRFSHRHVLIFPNQLEDGTPTSPVENYKEVLLQLLSVPVGSAKGKKKGCKRKSAAIEQMDTEQDIQHSIPVEVLARCKVDPNQFSGLEPSYLEDWNSHVKSLVQEEKVVDAIEKLCYYNMNEQIFRSILFQLVSKLSPTKPYIDATVFIRAIDNTVAPEHRVKLLQSLSILELSLVIAMMHGMEIFDGQPMNFEMVLNRYTKFANTNSSTQTVPRPVVLKAFEHLSALEIVAPTRGPGAGDAAAGKVQREYRLYTLAVPAEDIREAVKGFKALPTEISHWLNNSVF